MQGSIQNSTLKRNISISGFLLSHFLMSCLQLILFSSFHYTFQVSLDSLVPSSNGVFCVSLVRVHVNLGPNGAWFSIQLSFTSLLFLNKACA